RVSAVVVFAVGLSSVAQAQFPAIYNSRDAWQAAVQGSAQFSENFESFTRDTYFQTGPVNVGPFSLQQIGVDPNFGFFQNFIDVPPLEFGDNDGRKNAALFTKFGVNTVDMTFTTPVFAWGADFWGSQTSEMEDMVLIGTENQVLGIIEVNPIGFFGFVIVN